MAFGCAAFLLWKSFLSKKDSLCWLRFFTSMKKVMKISQETDNWYFHARLYRMKKVVAVFLQILRKMASI